MRDWADDFKLPDYDDKGWRLPAPAPSGDTPPSAAPAPAPVPLSTFQHALLDLKLRAHQSGPAREWTFDDA